MGVVLFAFGVAQVPPGGALAGPLLMRLVADLGLSGPAARSVLLRMRRDGLLISRRAGRVAHYQLALPVTSAEGRLERQLRGDRPVWSGAFAGLLYEVPEVHRPFRDRLRRVARLAGYANLRPGLLIAPTDRAGELAGALRDVPGDALVLPASVQLSAEDSRRVAAQLWQLDRLAERYRSAMASALAIVERAEKQPPTGRDALTAMADALGPIYDVAADDPDLPEQLLPPNWPGDQAGVAVGTTMRALAPAVGAYLDTLHKDLGCPSSKAPPNSRRSEWA